MKTLEEIKDEYAKENGFHDLDDMYSSLYGIYVPDNFDEIANRHAKEVAKQTLINVSENIRMKQGSPRPTLGQGQMDYIGTHHMVIDKESILNESNIPEL